MIYLPTYASYDDSRCIGPRPSGRTQRVIVDGQQSREAEVSSGVPQGTVMGPLLFLLYINDLPAVLDPSTKCRLFADGCLVYHDIHGPEDQIALQRDLDALEQWSRQWSMLFNAAKCNIMSVSRTRTPLQGFYQINNTILNCVDTYTYLGVHLSNNMGWSHHISSRVKKANSRLIFLRRNLRGCPQQLKRMAYVTLVRSLLEYSATIWDPHLAKDKRVLEAVQHRAARWIQGNYSSRSSVNAILEDLGLDTLEERRQQQRLTLMYKIVHGTVALTPADLGLLPADNRTRSTRIHKLHHQRNTTKELLHSFIPRTITEWNRLNSGLNSCLLGRGWLARNLQEPAKRTPGCLALAPHLRDTP